MKAILPFVAFAVGACVAIVPAQAQDAPPAATQDQAGWSEGFGRATNYRTALANAIEDAVGKSKGIAVARGPGVRSRLSVVANYSDQVPNGWFDGEADSEREWVQQQIAGFVQKYEVTKRDKANDGQWEVTVRAQVAMHDGAEPVLVIDLQDGELDKWQLERFEEGQATAFARDSGNYQAPRLAENLRRSGVVKIVANGDGVRVGSGAAVREREKAGQQLVASHRIVVRWQPMQLRSEQERPNRARPTSGPRPEYLTAGAVRVDVKVVDLVQNIDVLELPLTIPIDIPPGTTTDRRDAFVVALADKATATVAEIAFFALRPPVVLRKWPSDDGKDWLVEARIGKRVATGYDSFVVGNNGSLASPDWQRLGTAVLVGGTDTSCTFRLQGVEDPSRIEPKVTEVRPTRK